MSTPSMKPRIEITKGDPYPDFFNCRVTVGKGQFRDPLVTNDINQVVDWLAGQGIALEVPEPEFVAGAEGAAV